MAHNKLQYAQGENVSDTAPNSIGSGDTSITVNTISLWNSNGGPIVINRGASDQEYSIASGVSGSSLTIAERGSYGSSAVSHNANATIESVPFAGQWNDMLASLLNVLLQTTGALDTTKVVDLTTAQTLTNKTFKDSTTVIGNVSDVTKAYKWSLGGATTGKTMTLVSSHTDNRSITLPDATDTLAALGTAQTWTAAQTQKSVLFTNNAITATSNAATVPITSRLNTVTNNSAATLTITMTTASAVDGQLSEVRILDSSAAAQTITWVNTEDSSTTAPTTSNGSTTLPLSVLFQFNGGTTKWRTVAKT